MARSKTGSFWLTENVVLDAAAASGTRVQGTIDLGAYVDVGDQQALAIEKVDFIWTSGSTYSHQASAYLAGNGAMEAQLMDLNPATLFVRADDNTLIASAALNIDDTNGIVSSGTDFYPDNFGKLDESRMVVNDNLYVVAGINGSAVGGSHIDTTVRIKARIVKLSTKDWMAIAIQSTAADN